VGNAAHEVFEYAVGKVVSTDRPALESLVLKAFYTAGLPLANPNRVVEEFATMLAHPLGKLFDGQSLDDLTLAQGIRTAAEMRFTLPLPGGIKESDRLLAVLEAASSYVGPFQDHFAQLAQRPAETGRLFQGYLVGSIDLVAEVGSGESQRFVVLDYKNNLLSTADSYASGELLEEMAAGGYPLQALLYSVALHRYLAQRLDTSYRPEPHLGGAVYYYIRGAALPSAAPGDGLAEWPIPPALVGEVSAIRAGKDLGEGS